MCLVTRQRKPKILKRDLKVYKVLKEGGYSKYTNFCWTPKELCKENIHTTGNRGKDMKYCDSKAMDVYWRLSGCIEIDRGFHACCTKERARKLLAMFGFTEESVCEFLIPKGSEVYYDCTGLVVANQMMML